MSVALSVMDLVPVPAGRSRAQALGDMVALARTADAAGYTRYWLGEHHGSTTYLASATTILMGQVLAATERIGVASGGIMLPNHAPLVVAEQVGTLALLYPGRVALGLGRAPGTDAVTARALRRRSADPRRFADEVREILGYLGPGPDADAAVPGSLRPARPAPSAGGEQKGSQTNPQVDRRTHLRANAPSNQQIDPQADKQDKPQTSSLPPACPEPTVVRALPGEGTSPQTWILGSSVTGARVAGEMRLPFAVASHFAPSQAEAAMTTYRSVLADAPQPVRPRVAAAVNVVLAPTCQEAQRLFTTAMTAAARVVGGRPGPLDPPTSDLEAWRALVPGRERAVESSMALSFVGAPQEVVPRLRALVRRWDLDELLVVTTVHDPLLRRRSYELLAAAW
ncbi:MsnO8 family LLM class oxidoreductase [Actinomyces sp. oral taxon 897]|uniref:MsnO8 family LLM class oxidoreductase n=1 Tax=Actinomyces sp. oral taxon 897 TaxID=2081702 RepID=UPI000D04675A|nr:MsnO8 family LLM class oxidoreductase [Actinomyces sp. oral taxon 897]AVM61895.1 LLM class flavin-dependent oxidoreductase [Actinomyces sp. oral taxon 897]